MKYLFLTTGLLAGFLLGQRYSYEAETQNRLNRIKNNLADYLVSKYKMPENEKTYNEVDKIVN